MNRRCMQCGQATEEKDVYCVSCGKRLEGNEEMQQSIIAFDENNPKNTPLTLGDYMLIGLIIMIPIVNIIVFLIWALDKGENLNRRNLAKAGLIYLGIGFVLSIILGVGVMRALMLDQQYYPEYNYFDYETEMPGYDEFIPLPYDAEEV